MPPKTDTAGRAYHHGNLKAALLQETETILERDGMPGLTLRAVARAAGVTHAAPTNHFGDLTGLLSELAATGFNQFTAALADAMEAAGDEPRSRMKAMGHAYVTFARAHPGLFALMFRSERLDRERPALRDAIAGARQALASAVAARASTPPTSPLDAVAQAAAVWSLVHGFAVLLVDGRLDGLIASVPGTTPDALLNAVLAAAKIRD